MRIGVHTGKIIGGVVGTDIVRYDIYGEDVTIANKMESNGTVIIYYYATLIGGKNNDKRNH